MNKQLNTRQVISLLAVTLALFSLFAYLTDIHSLGLGSARTPEIWAISRYAIVLAWLVLAGLIFFVRDRSAYGKSFNHGLLCAGILTLVLASTWAEQSGGYAIFGSAISYALISALLCMTFKNYRWATLAAPVLALVQITCDFILLFIAGQFRIH